MYTSLLSSGDIDQGFSIIYGDVFSNLQLASLKELFKEEPHIFDTMINGTFSVTFSIRVEISLRHLKRNIQMRSKII